MKQKIKGIRPGHVANGEFVSARTRLDPGLKPVQKGVGKAHRLPRQIVANHNNKRLARSALFLGLLVFGLLLSPSLDVLATSIKQKFSWDVDFFCNGVRSSLFLPAFSKPSLVHGPLGVLFLSRLATTTCKL